MRATRTQEVEPDPEDANHDSGCPYWRDEPCKCARGGEAQLRRAARRWRAMPAETRSQFIVECAGCELESEINGAPTLAAAVARLKGEGWTEGNGDLWWCPKCSDEGGTDLDWLTFGDV